jgi:hypothetical protein
MEKQQVIQEFKKIRPRTTNHQIKHQKNEGKITYAEIGYKEQNSIDETAYILFSKNLKLIEDSEENLILKYATQEKEESSKNFNKIFTVTGIIAILLTIAIIIYVFVFPEKDVPDILKIVFTSIVSFYYGGHLTKNKGDNNDL